MCTLTYIPVNNGYIFTHNRDERTSRPSSDDIFSSRSGDQTLYFPRDLEAKGTWMAFSDRGTSACILNGGSQPYIRKERYRKSRGLVVLDSFNFQTVEEFYKLYDFSGIEPFTLLIRTPDVLAQVIHNKEETFLHYPDRNQTHIWSSTTLYTGEVREKREKWFYNWLHSEQKPDPENIIQFHLSSGDGDKENDLIMSRWGILRTVSLTQIAVSGKTGVFTYRNFISNTQNQKEVFLN